MLLEFFKKCMVSLIFLGINLISLSKTFFWSQLKLWPAFQQCLAISFLSRSQFLTDFLYSSERYFLNARFFVFTELDCLTVTTVNFINNLVYIFCSYSIFWFTKELQCWKSILFYEIWVYAVVFHRYLQRTVSLYSFWSLPLRYLWLVLVVMTEASYDY